MANLGAEYPVILLAEITEVDKVDKAESMDVIGCVRVDAKERERERKKERERDRKKEIIDKFYKET